MVLLMVVDIGSLLLIFKLESVASLIPHSSLYRTCTVVCTSVTPVPTVQGTPLVGTVHNRPPYIVVFHSLSTLFAEKPRVSR
jgi:hypothetical protein